MAVDIEPKRELVEKCKEFDDETRECSILLYTRPVDNPVVAGVVNPIFLHHWSLVAYFPEGDRLLTFEIMESEENIIEAYRTNGAYINADTRKKVVGSVHTSPKKLLHLAQKHSFNGTQYGAVSKNCQEWVKEFARMISETLHKAIQKFQSCKEVLSNPIGMIATAELVAINTISNGVKSSMNSLAGGTFSRYCEFAAAPLAASSANSLRNLGNSLSNSGRSLRFS